MEKLLEKLIAILRPTISFRLSVIAGAYFIYAFVAYLLNFAEFKFLSNLALFICCLIAFERKFLNRLWSLLCALGLIVLFYHNSYLPSPLQIQEVMLSSHLTPYEFLNDVIVLSFNSNLLILMCLSLLASFFLGTFVKIASCVVIAFVVLGFFNVQSAISALSEQTVQAQAVEDESPDLPPPPQGRTNDDLEAYYQTFLELEGQRKVDFVSTLPADFEPFDIVILNICSLAQDDLNATSLADHALFTQFDYAFDDFNCAASYSTPASLRLLRMNCGQMTEAEIYSGRRADCEIITALEGLGYEAHTFFDHDGLYGNYLKSLHDLAGLNDRLHTQKGWQIALKSFDGSAIYADKDLFASYIEHIANGSTTPKITFMNLLSLHDGNRYENEDHGAPYDIRLAQMLDDINSFVTDLSNSKRPTLLIMVPEHGAAIKGDKMQIAKLREIPNSSITKVPVLLKFFGAQNPKAQRERISGHFSYLALGEIINRAISLNVFSKDKAQGELDDVMIDLPQTAAVSEATNAYYVELSQQGYYMLKGAEWSAYKK